MDDYLTLGSTFLKTILILSSAIIAALLLHAIIYFVLNRIARRSKSHTFEVILNKLKNPIRFILLFVGLFIAKNTLVLPESTVKWTDHLFTLLIIVFVAWLLINTVAGIKKIVLEQFDFEGHDNLEARKVYTQFTVLERIVVMIILIVSIAAALMTFDTIKQLGTSILASAGIAGIIIGFAAQRSIATILAGFQIAITQPIRLDDVVIVEGEWGWIEEITLTYVVVRIWDKRRLIVPITYFIEKPFQNWTRVSADILGTVFIYADYDIDVEAVRKELTRLLESSEYWDGNVNVVQVTDATEKTMEIRALMSAKDSPGAWNLRVYVRENLIKFLQKKYPDSLPRVRVEMPLASEIKGKSKDSQVL